MIDPNFNHQAVGPAMPATACMEPNPLPGIATKTNQGTAWYDRPIPRPGDNIITAVEPFDALSISRRDFKQSLSMPQRIQTALPDPFPDENGAIYGPIPICDFPDTGHCIDAVSGEKQMILEDFRLPGPLPFAWNRIYRSRHSRDAGVGHGWTHSGCDHINVTETVIELLDDQGRRITFKRPLLYQKSSQLNEGLVLHFVSARQFILCQHGRPDKVFTHQAGNLYRLSQIRHRAFLPADKTLHASRHRDRGYAIDFHYNSSGRLIRIMGNWGRGLLLDRDENARITSIFPLDEKNRKSSTPLARYDYDDQGDLVAYHDANGQQEQYQYQNHIITQRCLVSGFSFYFEWDQLDNQGRCLRHWGDRGIYDYSFHWDTGNQVSHVTNSLGHTTRYHYDDNQQLTQQIDPIGNSTRYQYSETGVCITIVDPQGNKTQLHYNDQQRYLGMTDALGQQTGGSYSQGHMTTFVDAAGHRWQRRFNPQGLLEETTGPSGEINTYKYNKNGLITEFTDAAGRVVRYRWNVRAELIREIDPLGNQLHYKYGQWGRISAVIAQSAGQSLQDAKQTATTYYHYTNGGQLERIIDAGGLSWDLEYHENGKLRKCTNLHGRVIEYHYEEGLPQPNQRIDAAGHNIKYEYDKERKLRSLINETGDKTQFSYDANGRLTEHVGFDGRTQHFEYDEVGYLKKHLDAGQVQTLFERDALGQLHSKLSSDLSRENRRPEQTKSHYDALGRLVETYNDHQYLAFKYDPLGNVLTEQHCDLNADKQRIADSEQLIRHQYNILGQRVTTELPDGRIIQFSYHDSLACREITFADRLIATVKRDSYGREIQREQGQWQTKTEYDPQGRLIKRLSQHKSGDYESRLHECGYDDLGRMTWSKDGLQETPYSYDSLGRLTEFGGDHPEFIKYDAAGNILSISEKQPGNPGLAKGNRLLIQDGRKFDYDERGNLIKVTAGKGADSFIRLHYDLHYNLQNQLVKVVDEIRRQTTHYKYDPLGRRIEKQDRFNSRKFLWVGGTLVQELVCISHPDTLGLGSKLDSRQPPLGSGFQLHPTSSIPLSASIKGGEERRPGNEIKIDYLFEPDGFRPLAQIRDNKIYYYHLGTPMDISDETGRIVWKARLSGYGTLVEQYVEEIENNLRIKGQYFDEESGLHYNRYRYYDPSTGRYIAQDPMNLANGINPYSYHIR